MSEAKTKIVIDVGEGAKSLRTLKAEFKEGQKELEGLTVGTKAYVDQLKKLGSVKDEIEDLNKEINAFRPDQKLAAFSGAARGIAAGFEAATAASALFGDKAEDVEKTLLKVQSAMALANAVQEVGELGKAFQLLGSVIKSAIGSTGIGLLVIAIAAIAANWDRIKTAITGVNKEQEENSRLAKEAVESGKEHLNNLDAIGVKMKLAGKSEEEILSYKKQQYAIQQELIKEQLKADLILALNQEKAAERNKEILKSLLKFSTAPLQALISGIDYIAEKVSGKKLIDVNLADKMANVIFDPEAAKERTKALEDTYKKNALDILKQQDQFELELQGIRDAANKKAIEEINKVGEARAKKAAEDAAKKLQQEKNDLADEDFLAQEEAKRKADEAAKLDEEAAHKAALLNQSLENDAQKKAQEEQDHADFVKRVNERNNLRQAELQVGTEVVQGLGSLMQLVGTQGAEMQQFQKGLAVTQIAIDTAKAISGAVAQAQTVPFPGNLVAIATGVATVLANIARAKQLLESAGASPSLNLSGASGGGGGVRPPQINQVGNTSTLLSNLNNGAGHREQQPIQAYLTETQVTDMQKHIAKIEKKSKY